MVSIVPGIMLPYVAHETIANRRVGCKNGWGQGVLQWGCGGNAVDLGTYAGNGGQAVPTFVLLYRQAADASATNESRANHPFWDG